MRHPDVCRAHPCDRCAQCVDPVNPRCCLEKSTPAAAADARQAEHETRVAAYTSLIAADIAAGVRLDEREDDWLRRCLATPRAATPIEVEIRTRLADRSVAPSALSARSTESIPNSVYVERLLASLDAGDRPPVETVVSVQKPTASSVRLLRRNQ